MALHRFELGQLVHLKSNGIHRALDAERYCVTGLLPERDSIPQYRIRSETQVHDRVATEDSLTPIPAA